MLLSSLTKIRQSFALNLFKKILERPQEKSYGQVIKESESLGFLMDDIKAKNFLSPKLLPPKQDTKLTVVTELDDTLVYSFTPDEDGYLLAPLRKYDFYHEYPQYDAYLNIYKRKGLDQFLDDLVKNYEVVVWTTGVSSYLDILTKYIDREGRIKHKFHQEQCNRVIYEKEDIDEYVKDLNLLGRDLKRVVYLDSHALSYWLHPQNCVPVEEFRADNTNPSEDLASWSDELAKLSEMEDVRPYLDNTYLLRTLLKESKFL